MALSSILISTGTIIAIYGLLALGLNIKFGYNGLLDIGHVAFYLMGAYVTALLVLPPQKTQQFAVYIMGWNLGNWPIATGWLVALAAGTVAAGILGMLVALPAIRLRADYLAIAVLGISVIVKRIIQTESWLANGPDALRGWSSPLSDLFPLPPDTPLLVDPTVDIGLATFLLGLAVAFLWAAGIYLLDSVITDGNPKTRMAGIRHFVFAISTGGFGYLVTRIARSWDISRRTAAIAGGVIMGSITVALAAVGLGTFAALVFIGVPSIYSWVIGVAYIADYYDELPRSDSLIALGMTIVFVLTFSPLIILGGKQARFDVTLLEQLVIVTPVVGLLYSFSVFSIDWIRRPAHAGLGAGLVSVVAVGIGLDGVGANAYVFLVILLVGALLMIAWARVGLPSIPPTPRAAITIALAILGAIVIEVGYPGHVFAAGSEVRSTVGLLTTILLLISFVYGIFNLGYNWDRFGRGSEFVSVIGLAALWLFVSRYFVLSLIQPFKQAGVLGAASQLVQNLLWLLIFTKGIHFNYARFLFVVAVMILLVAYYLTETTVKAPFGRVLKAIREDEEVAMALGKDTFSFKVQSMVLGSALAGFAGGLSAIYFGVLVHTMFAPRVTFTVFLMVIIGGMANNRGVLLGSVIFWGFQRATEDLAGFFPTAARTSVQALRLALIGALLIIILYYRPEGIWGEQRVVSTGAEE